MCVEERRHVGRHHGDGVVLADPALAEGAAEPPRPGVALGPAIGSFAMDHGRPLGKHRRAARDEAERRERHVVRSEEHTSELQSLMRNSYAVFFLKKKKENNETNYLNRKNLKKHMKGKKRKNIHTNTLYTDIITTNLLAKKEPAYYLDTYRITCTHPSMN